MHAALSKIVQCQKAMLSNRRWLAALFATNVLGFIYGIYYYWHQLSITPMYLWIFVIDSPLPVLLFAVICAMIYLKKSSPQWLILFSFFGLIKYGIWTDIVIYLFRDYFFSVNPLIYGLNFHLHFGMVLEGLLLLQLLKPKLKDILFVGGFYLLNDYLDYFYGTVTLIPDGYRTFLMVESFAMTLILAGVAIYLRQKNLDSSAVPH